MARQHRITGSVKVRDATGEEISPASEGTAADILEALADRASELTLAGLLAAVASRRQVGCGVVAVGDTSAGNAVPCTTNQPCLYARVEAPSGMTVAVNGGEVKIAAVPDSQDVLTHANAVAQGRSLMQANYEGIIVEVDDTNKLRFVSTTAGTNVKVFAVIVPAE